MTTGYEAQTARNIESISRSLQEQNRILERIATALEKRFEPGDVDAYLADADDVR